MVTCLWSIAEFVIVGINFILMYFETILKCLHYVSVIPKTKQPLTTFFNVRLIISDYISSRKKTDSNTLWFEDTSVWNLFRCIFYFWADRGGGSNYVLIRKPNCLRIIIRKQISFDERAPRIFRFPVITFIIIFLPPLSLLLLLLL